MGPKARIIEESNLGLGVWKKEKELFGESFRIF